MIQDILTIKTPGEAAEAAKTFLPTSRFSISLNFINTFMFM